MSRELQFGWMWVQACELLERAERMHRQFVRYAGPGADVATWEPPVDIHESNQGLLMLFAMPGVEADTLQIIVEPDALTVSGMRPVRLYDQDSVIHRLEIPHGRFARRVALSGASYEVEQFRYSNGLLEVRLMKTGASEGRE